MEILQEFLHRTCDELLEHKALFRRVRDNGGHTDFFIGWFTSNNSGETFDSELLGKLVELGIDLDFDVYG